MGKTNWLTGKLLNASYPNQGFAATVTRISDKAGFTLQNVQTKIGRQTTVYAIELAADNTG